MRLATSYSKYNTTRYLLFLRSSWSQLRSTQHDFHECVVVKLNPTAPSRIVLTEGVGQLLHPDTRPEEAIEWDTSRRTAMAGGHGYFTHEIVVLVTRN
jgi:hypothetical protein